MINHIWQPIIDSTSQQYIAESERSFTIKVIYGPDDVQDIESMHDGIIHFVTVDVPPVAHVEVE